MTYYRLSDDINYPQRWYLGDIKETDDNWQFSSGQRVNEFSLEENLSISVYQDGKPMDYTTNETYGVPIISEKIKRQFDNLNELQFIPVNIDGKNFSLNYFIMIVASKKNCVNEELSEFGKFIENDPIRPDLAGEYSWFTKLVIDPAKINGADIFRIDKATNYLVVSERMKRALENLGATGVKFIQV